MMHAYRFGSAQVAADASDLQRHLATAYKGKQRPLCACQPDGVPMYIAKLEDPHAIQLQPYTGAKHAPTSPPYAPTPELSRPGALPGRAAHHDAQTQPHYAY
ncbi:DUF1173 family protein, partial [Burkholderia contaminans]